MEAINILKRKRGRPAGVPKMVFYRRVTEEQAKAMSNWLKKTGCPEMISETDLRNGIEKMGPTVHVSNKKGNYSFSADYALDKNPELEAMVEVGKVKALLDDVEAKTKEIEDLKERLDKVSKATDDQKLRWWIQKYEAVCKKYGANEHDQT